MHKVFSPRSGRLKRVVDLAFSVQPSASRTIDLSDLDPSSELLGYYHSSAKRTDKTTFCAEPADMTGRMTTFAFVQATELETLTPLLQRDVRGARALDALHAFISQRRQI